VRPVVPLHHQLVSAGHQGETIAVVECLRDVLTEGVSCSSRRDAPASSVIRVRPEQVTHGTLVWHLLESVQGADMIQRVNTGTESTVETEDLTVHQSSEGQVVKQVGEVLPHVGIAVLPQALVIKPVNLSDLSRLVIASKNCDSLAEANLKNIKL